MNSLTAPLSFRRERLEESNRAAQLQRQQGPPKAHRTPDKWDGDVTESASAGRTLPALMQPGQTASLEQALGISTARIVEVQRPKHRDPIETRFVLSNRRAFLGQ